MARSATTTRRQPARVEGHASSHLSNRVTQPEVTAQPHSVRNSKPGGVGGLACAGHGTAPVTRAPAHPCTVTDSERPSLIARSGTRVAWIDIRLRSLIRARPGGRRQLLRQPSRGAAVRRRMLPLMSALDVTETAPELCRPPTVRPAGPPTTRCADQRTITETGRSSGRPLAWTTRPIECAVLLAMTSRRFLHEGCTTAEALRVLLTGVLHYSARRMKAARSAWRASARRTWAMSSRAPSLPRQGSC